MQPGLKVPTASGWLDAGPTGGMTRPSHAKPGVQIGRTRSSWEMQILRPAPGPDSDAVHQRAPIWEGVWEAPF